MRAEEMKAWRIRAGRQKTVTIPVHVLAGLLDSDELAAAIAEGKAHEDCAAAEVIAAISGYLGSEMVKAIRVANHD
jgi:hypothetical protein